MLYGISLQHTQQNYAIILEKIGLYSIKDFIQLDEEIEKQKYKCLHITPGEIVHISSSNKYIQELFFTKNPKKNKEEIIFSINEKQEVKYYILHYSILFGINTVNVDLQDWHPVQAFFHRIEHMALLDSNQYTRLKENQESIQALLPGQHGNIAPTLQVIRTLDGHYVALSVTEDENIFINLDALPQKKWRHEEGMWLNMAAIAFLERLKAADKQYMLQGLPKPLLGIINKLHDIYSYLLNTVSVKQQLMVNQSFRITKAVSRLEKTLNVVYNPLQDEWMLILKEQKIKVKKENTDNNVFAVCWRIDLPIPEKWFSKTQRNDNVHNADLEALFSQNLIKLDKNVEKYFNVTFLGQMYKKWSVKRSQYSLCAIADLQEMYDDNKLNQQDIHRIMQNVLEGVVFMHRHNLIHQDIKLPNILIYKDDMGYYAKIGDFDSSYHPRWERNQYAIATREYESPEILIAYQPEESAHHSYYWENGITYTHQIVQQIRDEELSSWIINDVPCEMSDMWAIGVLFFKLRYGQMPSVYQQDKINNDPLIQGLLRVKRWERFSASWALKQLLINKIEKILLDDDYDSDSDSSTMTSSSDSEDVSDICELLTSKMEKISLDDMHDSDVEYIFEKRIELYHPTVNHVQHLNMTSHFEVKTNNALLYQHQTARYKANQEWKNIKNIPKTKPVHYGKSSTPIQKYKQF